MTTPRPDGGRAGIYRVRRTYPMTEVLGWWLTSTKASPRWVPVMGDLHEDSRFFSFNLLHYHVDPRFLEPKVNEEVQRSFNGWTRWHAAYTEVLAYFAIEGDAEHYFTLTPDATLIFARDGGMGERDLDRAWGEARIQRRTRDVRCCRRLPRRLSDPEAQGFTALVGEGWREGDPVDRVDPTRYARLKPDKVHSERNYPYVSKAALYDHIRECLAACGLHVRTKLNKPVEISADLDLGSS